jgi:peroxiredoxin Q/BCP
LLASSQYQGAEFMAFPKTGNLAPAFSLKNQDGKTISLKDFKGKKNVVLYFYPKASTPGCTTQACGIRDSRAEFAALDTVVLGVSPDAQQALQKFIEKQELNFDLLSDPEHQVAEKYGAWGLKKFMGREYMGILRTSFLIDREGRLCHIFDTVKTKTHDRDVIALIKANFRVLFQEM